MFCYQHSHLSFFRYFCVHQWKAFKKKKIRKWISLIQHLFLGILFSVIEILNFVWTRWTYTPGCRWSFAASPYHCRYSCGWAIWLFRNFGIIMSLKVNQCINHYKHHPPPTTTLIPLLRHICVFVIIESYIFPNPRAVRNTADALVIFNISAAYAYDNCTAQKIR